MARIYNWTDDEDEVAMDAVTVGIGTDTRILKIGGLEFGKPKAWVYWPETTNRGIRVEARSEGPFEDVPAALDYAETMARTHGFSRVAIAIQDRDLWDKRWGSLNPKPGVR